MPRELKHLLDQSMAPPHTSKVPEARSVSAREPYEFPKKFKIGLHSVEPLVSLAQIKDHLALLGAFAALRSKVEGPAGQGLPSLTSDPARRWAWFVGLA